MSTARSSLSRNPLEGDGDSLVLALLLGCVLVPGSGIVGSFLFAGPETAEMAFRLSVALTLPTLLMVAVLYAIGQFTAVGPDD
ncbi:hypothetical protein [Halobiforma nitratireducens]|uniref:Uncharacterized protein n=1 Tax=Halobiforma nitratireducens JCM 10879 TaxID=1227454 RepID=M0LXH0_9EURY|nr:hypothetical protein [Halobiforma nitratireducens]EMA36805.1 hypothetical protein C446_11372 [Halobiforma nitratireducens JCM 10879]